ncbi:transketolase family protein [Sphingomonas sp. MMS12-HWE2-04]|uniref:transketolase family protein n=1 Tax=Sphingomonas sp. MMS12-HWE2-04 TaxID=3234199 RepID=UPI00384A7E41
MREAFSDALVQLANEDDRVLLLTGDHGYALFDQFRTLHPDRFINAGIAEQNMVGMAAGLARMGFRPFVYGLSAFVPVRVLEQIKIDVAHDDLPVVFIGDGAGFVYSYLGTSHQSLEDIACCRAIPGLTILSPADRHELKASMRRAHDLGGPVYLRMGKSDRGDVHQGPLVAGLEQLHLLKPGKPGGTAVLATGSMVWTALRVADALTDLAVWSVPQLKPFSGAGLVPIYEAATQIVTIEEHSMMGGLGALIAEESSTLNPLRILRIGVEDRFSEHAGSYEYLLHEHGLDVTRVTERIQAFVGNG